MAVTAKWYTNGVLKVMTGAIDLDTDTFKAMLTTSSYTPNQNSHDFRDDVTNEITGTGYSAGGVTLGTLVVSQSTNDVNWDFADPSWASASFTANKMVVYKSRGGASSADELVMYVDFGADQTVSSGTFTYVVPAAGAAKITTS